MNGMNGMNGMNRYFIHFSLIKIKLFMPAARKNKHGYNIIIT
jgi:hypothetical protein